MCAWLARSCSVWGQPSRLGDQRPELLVRSATWTVREQRQYVKNFQSAVWFETNTVAEKQCVLGSLASVSQSSFGFDSIYDTPSKLCLKCPTGLNACNQGGVVTPSSCTDLSSPIPSRFLDDNCGSCGRKCSGDQPHCVSGTCGCRANLVDGLDMLCGLDRFCSAGSTCAKCQEGFANCNLNSESGGPSDCEVNINSNVANCAF